MYIENPTAKDSVEIPCPPQDVICKRNCLDCFFQSECSLEEKVWFCYDWAVRGVNIIFQ